jgi:hypothetical protein
MIDPYVHFRESLDEWQMFYFCVHPAAIDEDEPYVPGWHLRDIYGNRFRVPDKAPGFWDREFYEKMTEEEIANDIAFWRKWAEDNRYQVDY